jgi:hypothetical protein
MLAESCVELQLARRFSRRGSGFTGRPDTRRPHTSHWGFVMSSSRICLTPPRLSPAPLAPAADHAQSNDAEKESRGFGQNLTRKHTRGAEVREDLLAAVDEQFGSFLIDRQNARSDWVTNDVEGNRTQQERTGSDVIERVQVLERHHGAIVGAKAKYRGSPRDQSRQPPDCPE